jgi:iron complex transport system substrate-binding protein
LTYHFLGEEVILLRIVSLLASATEFVAALGFIDQLVGRSHECDWPLAVRSLPAVSTVQIDIGASSVAIDAEVRRRSKEAQVAPRDALQALSLYHINIDMLRELQPDVIFTQMQCQVCAVSERDVIAALNAITGLSPRIVSLAPYRLADVWEDVIRIGEALDCLQKAVTFVAAATTRLDHIRKQSSDILQHQPRPRVAMIEWMEPLMAAGNWTPELVEIAGGENLFGQIGMHSPGLTWDALVGADPDVIVVAPCGFTLVRTLSELPIMQRHPLWGNLRAVRSGNVFIADGNAYFNRSGPRLVDSAEILAAILTGGHAHQEDWQQIT